ncbi:MAG: hypothetical protein OXF84_06185, partial [Bacteroidetes bacterium]|nr:hypothetical protein [Bacteroidota bacterium]
MGAAQDRIYGFLRRQWNWPTDHGTRRFHGLDNFLRTLVDQRMIVGLEANTDFLPGHRRALVKNTRNNTCPNGPSTFSDR